MSSPRFTTFGLRVLAGVVLAVPRIASHLALPGDVMIGPDDRLDLTDGRPNPELLFRRTFPRAAKTQSMRA